MTRVLPSLSLLAALLGAACSSPDAPAPVQQPPPAAEPAPPEPATPADYGQASKIHMRHHFADASALNNAVIRGDLAAGREPALRLADHEPLVDAPGFAPDLVATISARARTAANATSLAEASVAVRDLGLACGGCHGRAETTPC